MTTEHYENPLVVIWSLVYNHHPYLRDFFQGILMQQTNFRFILIVHDDKSTDGSTDIICEYAEKYPDIIKPILESENQYSKKDGSIDRIMYKAISSSGAKYIAFCEGDDYWTDPFKLQKQVNFLETHPEYGMCYTKVQRYIEKSKCFKEEWGGTNTTFSQLIRKNTIPTLSVVIKSDIYELYNSKIKPENQHWKMGDYPLWLFCSHMSKIGFLNIITGVYRVLENSASHFKNYISQLEFSLSGNLILAFFLEYFNENIIEKDFINLRISFIIMRIALITNTNRKDAIKAFRKAFQASYIFWKKEPTLICWYMIPRIISKIAETRYYMLH